MEQNSFHVILGVKTFKCFSDISNAEEKICPLIFWMNCKSTLTSKLFKMLRKNEGKLSSSQQKSNREFEAKISVQFLEGPQINCNFSTWIQDKIEFTCLNLFRWTTSTSGRLHRLSRFTVPCWSFLHRGQSQASSVPSYRNETKNTDINTECMWTHKPNKVADVSLLKAVGWIVCYQ